MILILVDFLCNLALLLINTITKILSSTKNIHRTSSSESLEPQQLLLLQETRSALLLQQEEISRQLVVIYASIKKLTQLHLNHQNDPSRSINPVISSSVSAQPESTNITPVRRRRRRTTQQLSGCVPYPLPFQPPRTPDEERRNNIVAWINDLRQQQYSQNEHPK
jgi:hypothetical protein